MLEIILWIIAMIIAGIVLAMLLANMCGYSQSPTGSLTPKSVRRASMAAGGNRSGEKAGEDPLDPTPLAEQEQQPPANRIAPVTLFAILVTGSYGQTPKLAQMIGEWLTKESSCQWQAAALKEKATVIIPVFVQPYFGKSERIEYTYCGEVAGGDVFFRNTKTYKFALYPNEADIFALAAKKIAEDIFREHTLYEAKRAQSS